ncbi:poly-gamma-glutamate synthase PgsB [Streptomyces sp. NBC_00053]|uniref:poly-gamma-glutamate synthase PgsB n=1 Tax=unclassified Streptomyces TaxID=2593676 RepID=UPI0022576710|nr:MULTISPECIES: poly-gamma-glutamate synthase PgsB [unclassified Streptomyces]MCX5501124.1 poly-gamma-glutamate synthase PgsB [Streptomyces sp. NBC_00052]MCX5550341.1 poly-gamma-glutamate synthase PgsB [Streptomyces sp. NBC_00051]
MLFLYGVLVVCCAILLISGIVEQRRHFTNLERIPTRVLINGIRGKSSITRLCAGALRGGDLVTVAKTTGTAARFIHPDATEEPVYRKFGIANVVEQIGIVRRAASYNPDALVIECMAVMPALQEINQSKLIRSTIGVLCNVREDHLAEMGPTLDDVARSLCRSMPEGGICVTAEQDRFHILQEEADARDCKLIYADPETVSDEELRGFSWFTFKENVAIALTVAELLGVDRQTALQGMYDAPPDPGVLSVERYRTHDDKRLRFANVFAANDPESTLMNINQLLDLGAIDRPLNVVINCRPDRVERNGQMGQIIPDLQPEKVFVIGHPAKSAIDAIPSEWRHTAVDLGGDKRDPEEFMNELLGHLGPESSLVAIGNIHGQGELLLEHLAELPADETPDEVLDGAPGRQSTPAPAGTAPAPEAADATDPDGNPAGNPAGTPSVALFPPVPSQRQQSPQPQPQPQQASHPQQPQQEQQSRQQPRHDETLALPRYTPHIDPYQPYPEAYEARYQQPPRPQPHPHHQPQSHAQSHAQSHPQNQHEPSHRSPETPAEQPPAAPRVRGLFEPVLPPAPAEEDPARQEHPAQQEYPGEPR